MAYVCPCGVVGSPHDRIGEGEHHSAYLHGKVRPLRAAATPRKRPEPGP